MSLSPLAVHRLTGEWASPVMVEEARDTWLGPEESSRKGKDLHRAEEGCLGRGGCAEARKREAAVASGDFRCSCNDEDPEGEGWRLLGMRTERGWPAATGAICRLNLALGLASQWAAQPWTNPLQATG